MIDTARQDFSLEMNDIPTPAEEGVNCAAKVQYGKQFPPQQLIMLFSSDDWEAFVEEWAYYQKKQYTKVTRLAGSKDMGIDVAAFSGVDGFQGVWDNYQCKHYSTALRPKTAITEIGKCLWHAFNDRFKPPRKYYFMAPKNCGMSLKKLLLNTADLKAELPKKWDDWCANSITATATIKFEGDFRDFVETFDFGIFTFKPTLEMIDEHSKTPYHAVRFGGGLPERPHAESPPEESTVVESRYLKQLMDAYADHMSTNIGNEATLSQWPDLTNHYQRQREFFYHAESLRNFARDTVPPMTFEELQDEIFAGVADVEASPHPDAFVRVNSVTQAAAQLSPTTNGLISVTKVQDKRGICHQLANKDRLQWVKS